MTVDCEWDDWPDNWTACTQNCGGGIQTKTRGIKREERHGGQACEGESTITQGCNMTACDDGKGILIMVLMRAIVYSKSSIQSCSTGYFIT